MRALPILVGLGLGIAGSGAFAADCSNAETQTDMNQCASAAFDTADAALNTLYKQVTGRLKEDPAALKLLVSAQRAWLAYRDAECAFAASGVSGGSIQPMITAGCLQSLTEARSADFRRYLSCEEGDLSCPVPAP